MRDENKSLKVTMLFSNPLCVENLDQEFGMKYETKYSSEFYKIID